MNFTIFLIYTTFGSLIWNTVLVILGNIVGDNYLIAANIFSKYSKILLIIFIIIIIIKIFKKRKIIW